MSQVKRVRIPVDSGRASASLPFRFLGWASVVDSGRVSAKTLIGNGLLEVGRMVGCGQSRRFQIMVGNGFFIRGHPRQTGAGRAFTVLVPSDAPIRMRGKPGSDMMRA